VSYFRTLKEEFKERNQWLIKRLDTLIPHLLRRENVDMWIVTGRENNEGPVLKTMLPQEFFGALGENILVFVRDGDQKVHRFSISKPLSAIDKYYQSVWYKQKGKQWQTYYDFMASRGRKLDVNLDDYEEESEYECLKRLVKTYDPKNIALNYSVDSRFADGISHTAYCAISNALGDEYAERIVSAERLCIGWLETRIEEELDYYEDLVAFTQAIIKKAYSREVITPGVTTNTDVRFFMMQTARDMGASPWFEATVWVRRNGESSLPDDDVVIVEGDILHCDFGVEYMGLNTDIQELAYVAKAHEDEVNPTVLKALKQANLLQDCVVSEIALLKSGNDVLMGALKKAKALGLKPSVYTHPIGFHGHAAGTMFGKFDWQKPLKGVGDYPVYPNTMFALELNVTAAIDSWNGQEIMVGLETDIAVREDGSVHYFGKRQTEPHFVK